ncbi:LacI family DNA-binding transcriptional regulator [Thioalkalivibrio sp. HK1]|uniref:LacI family DNA-binding transcriptional regulator n=1 Tax=Thioalkalivibrio sp. HK1 TaxID=1469245 RepID=UPI000570FFDB|nr:LacI family DNA-binding transcriptional regulator [Thioalkalivibrio sp. HK1]
MAAGKPTVNDIARHAGVSLATVDRVLNERPGVRSATIAKVNRAIDDLGYVRDTAAANLARRRIYRLLFVLPDSGSELIKALKRQIAAQAKLLVNERTRLEIRRTTPFDSRETAQTLDDLRSDGADGVDGVAILAPETPQIRDAIVRTRARGIAVVSIISDLPSSTRDHFIGIDNISAGRTAARLMGRFLERKKRSIAVIIGSRHARDHLERRHGFDLTMAKDFPHLCILPSIEARDSADPVFDGLRNAWRANHDIGGIYSSSDYSQGLIRFLKGIHRKPVVIGHELTPDNHKALDDRLFDAVIAQDLGHIVRSAVRLLRATVDSTPFNAPQERIGIDIYLRENLPAADFPL